MIVDLHSSVYARSQSPYLHLLWMNRIFYVPALYRIYYNLVSLHLTHTCNKRHISCESIKEILIKRKLCKIIMLALLY